MAPVNKGVLFGPIRKCGEEQSKVILELEGEVGVKKRRDFVLEDVTSWHKIDAFGEKAADALRNVYRRTQLIKQDGDAHRSWDHAVT